MISGARVALSSGAPLQRQEALSSTLGEALKAAAGHPDKGILHVTPEGSEHFQSYAELLLEAERILGGLHGLGVTAGQQVILQLAHSRDFLPALWACFLGGIVPVPAGAILNYDAHNATLKRLFNVWQLLDRPLLLALDEDTPRLMAAAREASLEGFRASSVNALRASEPVRALPKLDSRQLALLLQTSGSTGLPKVVTLSHRNILARCAGAIQKNGFGGNEVTLNWMPMEHVGAIVSLGVMAVDLGCTQLHAPTELILAQPLKWLDLMHRHRASISWAPNFAFALINQQAEQLARASYDLSSMRFLINAGEQVAPKTVRTFLELLARHHLPAKALRPAFGMSETCSGISYAEERSLDELAAEGTAISLGRPIAGASIRITDAEDRLLEEGQAGHVQLRGPSVTEGYYKNPEKNAASFREGGWFVTGDLGYLRDGQLFITGREKQEIIINGNNFVAAELEAAIEELRGVRVSFTAAFAARDAQAEADQLIITFCPEDEDPAGWPELISEIRGCLVKHMGIAPAHILPLSPPQVPKTAIGKIQRARLRQDFESGLFAPRIQEVRERLSAARAQPTAAGSALELEIAEIWQQALGLEAVGLHENFFELGGHSVLLMQVHKKLQERFARQIALVDLFKYSTVAELAKFLSREDGGAPEAERSRERARRRKERSATGGSRDITVIGMGCRFPGADSVEEFWRNLRNGVESITFFTDEEIAASGVDPRSAKNPRYVKASPILKDVRGFDAAFFGYSAAEAELMDPQHRLFLECAWEAMEDAGYDPLRYEGSVGLYAGVALNTYLMNNVLPNRRQLDENDDLSVATVSSMGGFQLLVGNDKDFVPTRVSYKLNLRGPSVSAQTACSTGLVVIHMACQSLLDGQCDMAMAGSSSVQSPQIAGHLYQEGMFLSRDGHCRAFDADASGMIFGSGVGAVLLKRLEDALADGDHIYAVIKGSAINNDGGMKLGYMAPSSEGQARVAAEALTMAEVEPETITLMEAHGTGTDMGDPIEVEGLSSAFRQGTAKKQFCALGSVKTNVGHLQISSGMVGFMKAVLALHHREIPPTLHFTRPNPRLGLEDSPFYVNTRLRKWETEGAPRRAGVNSLGIGGTNAHVILEEAPARPAEEPRQPRGVQLLVLSAKSERALEELAQRYVQHLDQHPTLSPSELCFTASQGRAEFSHRLAVVGGSLAELRARLAAGEDVTRTPSGSSMKAPKLAFLFTGQGSQYASMGKRLYETEPLFRQTLDHCALLLQPLLERPLLELMFAPPGSEHAALLDRTDFTQPALFCLEYSLALLWRSWGVVPDVLMGHSVGELAAACLAGVFSLEDGLKLIAARGRLMHSLSSDGAMLSVQAPSSLVLQELRGFESTVSLGAENGPNSCVISGLSRDVLSLSQKLSSSGIKTKLLPISIAAHSPLIEPMLAPFREVAQSISYRPAQLPVISNVTGELAGPQLSSAEYWVQHVRACVRFASGMHSLASLGVSAFLEIGPHPTLSGMGAQCLSSQAFWLPSLRRGQDDSDVLLRSLAQFYVLGGSVDWRSFYLHHTARRVPLPSYPFQRRSYWLEPTSRTASELMPLATDGEHYPLSGHKVEVPGERIHYVVQLSPQRQPYLFDHVVYGRVVVAGAFHVSVMLSLASRHWQTSQVNLESVQFVRPLTLGQGGTSLHAVLIPSAEEPGSAEIELYARHGAGDEAWQLHAKATASHHVPAPAVAPSLSAVKAQCPSEVAPATITEALEQMHIEWRDSWMWTRSCKIGERQELHYVEAPAELNYEDAPLHPAMLDNIFGSGLVLMTSGDGPMEAIARLPIAVEQLRLYKPAVGPVWSQFISRDRSASLREETCRCDLRVWDTAGELVAEIEGLVLKRAPQNILMQLGAQGSPRGDWIHQLTWQPLPSVSWPRSSEDSVLLISEARDEALARALEAQLVLGGARVERCAGLEGVRAFLRRGGSGRIVALWRGQEESALAASALAQVEAARQQLRAILAEGESSTQLSWITCSAQAVSDEPLSGLAGTPLWGLGRVVMQEHPELSLRLIDIDPDDSQLEPLSQVLLSDGDERQLALRQGRAYALRLEQPASEPKGPAGAGLDAAARGTVLITGGLGALGLLVARHLVERHGARHLLLLGRSAPSAQAAEALEALRALGATVTFTSGDVADRAALEAALARIDATQPLRGIIHAAGVLEDRVVRELDEELLRRVWEPKALGALHLHELTQHLELDFFVLFSSVASVIGSAGQGSYAAANALLDGLCLHRRQRGLNAHSLNWGPWQHGGMAARLSTADKARIARAGIGSISPEAGLALLTEFTKAPSAQRVVAPLDTAALASSSTEALATLYRSRLKPRPAARTSRSPRRSLHAELQSLPALEREPSLERLLQTEIAGQLSLASPSEVPLAAPLTDLGMDSLRAVELRNRLAKLLDKRLPATLLFDYPTVKTLARYLLDEILELGEEEKLDNAQENSLIGNLAQALKRVALTGPLPPPTGDDPSVETMSADEVNAALDRELLSLTR